MRARGLERLRGEEGIALVLAVLVLAIVTILATAVIAYTTTNQQDAASKKSGVSAYALAQAALSNATAQLTSHYYDLTGQPFDNTTSLTTMASPPWVPVAPNGGLGQQSPSSAAACTATSSCMTWSGVLRCPVGVSCAGGGSPYTPSGVKQAAWHITATGKVPNPSAAGLLTRTITVDIPVEAPPAKTPAPEIFKAVYTGATSTSTDCDFSTPQGVHFYSPVYVVGNLCLGQQSSIEAGPTNLGKLVVGGWIDLAQQANIGDSATPLASLDVAESCDGSRTPTQCTLMKPAGKNYYTDAAGKIFVTARSNSPTFPPPPSVNWAQRQTERGTWSCTNGHSLTAATFNLTGTPYTCTTESGTLNWDGTTLAVSGNVYVDGNLFTPNNAQFVYTGLGSIYVGGSASFGNNTSICVGSTSNHDCPNGANWPNIADNFLLILARHDMSGGQSNSNFSIEGGVYSEGNINFGAGQTNIYGPIVTPTTIDPGQQAASGFPNILDLFTGAPGTPQPYWVLGPPQDGTY